MSNEGIYNKHEIVEFIIKSLDGIKVSGAHDVNLLSQAYQMLFALQQGLKDEDNAKDKTIEMLKEQLRRATEPQVDDGGEVLGGEHYELKFGGAEDGTN